MSHKERFGSAVWQACMTLADEARKYAGGFFSIGEVCRVSGVSRPTARKYLSDLSDRGYLDSVIFANGMRMYKVLEK